MKLQILVPQYDETDEVIKPLLDSISIQQRIDFKEIGVIIVNDGSDTHLSNDFLTSYPFEIQYILNEHKGVSATRNACLDKATADYVMFCDADDMFFNACAFWMIFNEMKAGFDSITSSFVEELKINGEFTYVNHPIDSTFVHGKIHRLKYLKDNNIRWNDNLTIHEDSYFNILCQNLSTEVKLCQVPFYLWRWRDSSVCRHDPKYILKTFTNMLDSNDALVDEFEKRGKVDLANQYAFSMVYDAYFTMNKDEWINQENKEYRNKTEKRFKDYYIKHMDKLQKIDKQKQYEILSGMRQRFYQEGMLMETTTFNDWIKHILSL